MADEITLTIEQVNLGVYIQDMIDAFGSCLVPGQHFRDIFQTNTDGLCWLCLHNSWILNHDVLLDVTRVTSATYKIQESKSIRQLEKCVKKMARRKEAP